MAVAFDAAAELERTNTSDPATWTHTPVARPMAIVVSAVHGTSTTDHVSTVTYGGVSMSRVVRATDTATELGAAELWFLGAGVPAGAQTVSADLTSGTTDDIHFVSMSFTANSSCEVVDFDSINENATNPSVTLSYASRTCISVAALYGGGASPAAFTPNGNCTTVHDRDLGAFYSEVIRQSTPGTSDFAIGGTAGGDDVAYVALALAESITAPIVYPTGLAGTTGLGTVALGYGQDVLIRVGNAVVLSPEFTDTSTGDHEETPTGQSVTASLGTAAVSASSSVSPTGLAGTSGLGTPAVTADHAVTPTGQSVTASLGSASLAVDSSVSPTGQSVTAALGTVQAGVIASVEPGGQEVTAGLGTPSVTASSVVVPDGLEVTAALGTPDVMGGAFVEPTGLQVTASVGTPDLAYDATVTPTGLEATASLGTPVADNGETPAVATPVPYGEPISPPKRRPKQGQVPEPWKPTVPERQDAMVAVSGFDVRAGLGTTWQVADCAIAPLGHQVGTALGRPTVTGMHNPTDAQIVEWMIAALNATV